MEKRKQISSSLIFIALTGCGFLYCLMNIEDTTLSIHPLLLPSIVLGLMLLLSVCRLAVGLMMPKETDGAKDRPVISKRTLLTLSLILIYAVLFKSLGFVISSALYLFAQMWLLRTGKKNYVLMAALSVVGPLLIYLLFVYALDVMLPAGILWF